MCCRGYGGRGHPTAAYCSQHPTPGNTLALGMWSMQRQTHVPLTATSSLQAPSNHQTRLGDVVHVLRLDDGLHIVLQHPLEVVLQLAAAEVGQDLAPVGRRL